MQKILDTLSEGLQKYFHENDFQRAVIGISGGVDSALTATIAVRALGKENVTGLIMPHPAFSQPDNMQDARELCAWLGMNCEEITIDRFAEQFFELPWARTDVTRGNIMARLRMIILYSWANEYNALVLGTCNKSETLLGYETKFGDGASDISVIGDLWKTEVWKLAAHLNLPKQFLTKAPSAELFTDHTDEEELGFSYHFADEVLQKWEQGKKLDEADPKVQAILRRVRENEHKRKMAPVIKISH